MFSHRVSGADVAAEYFSTAAEALSASGSITAATHMFSRMNELESLRRADGKLQFRLVYPLMAAPPNTMTWLQSSNPTTARIITDYTPLNVPAAMTGGASSASGSRWGGGLRRSFVDGANNDGSIYPLSDGSNGDCCAWYAIGMRFAYGWAGATGMAAVAEVNVQHWVQLYVTV